MARRIVKEVKQEIVDNSRGISEQMKKDFLTYALSTITRGIPLTNDGLKPVQRRILYVLLNYERRLTKSARIVGDTLGMYHPHGDSAVYNAMVSLAQPFKRNYPLVEGQGNWGNIDGDGAASMRYTECKISQFCKDVFFSEGWEFVDWSYNYDDTLKEPCALAPAIPILMVNGSRGIITGFANHIPPHNLKEVCQATLAYLNGEKDPLSCIKGPDFPTGGMVYADKSYLYKCVKEGTGRVEVKPRYSIISWSHGRFAIEFSELPYGVSKENILDKFKKMYKEEEILHKNIPNDGIVDLSDSKICLNFVFKKGVKESGVESVLEWMMKAGLFVNTLMYSVNVVEADAAKDGVVIIPKKVGFDVLIDDWYKHRSIVLKKYFDFKIEDIKHKIKLNQDLQIFIKNYEKLSMVLLRYPYDSGLIEFVKFGIDKEGYDYILGKSFRTVQNKGDSIKEDRKVLDGELKYYNGHRKNIKKYIEEEVVGIMSKYSRPRRTLIMQPRTTKKK